MLGVVTYHNPACGTSRNALDFIRNASVEPHVIECPKTPPTQALVKLLEWFLDRAGRTVREILREEGTLLANSASAIRTFPTMLCSMRSRHISS